MPYSLIWFAATAVIFLLQAFPLTGVFLMFLLAPFWSVLTVNVGMVSLAVEALLKPRFLAWLLVPVVYFGGYVVYAWKTNHDFSALEAQVRQINQAAGQVAFDPGRHDLVVRTGRGSVLSGAANGFVQRYGLEVAYQVNENLKTAGHMAYRVGRRPVCEAVRADKRFRAAFIHAYGLKAGRKSSRDFCALSGPEDPMRPTFFVTGEQRRESFGALKARIYDLTIRTPEGQVIRRMTASAATLPTLPMPVIGCVLNSGAPSWDCSAGFMRGKMRGAGGAGGYGAANLPLLAVALGLSEAGPENWAKIAAAELPMSFRAVARQRIALSMDNLDRIIGDPTERLTVHDIRGLRDDLSLWRDRVPAMVDALGRAFDAGSRAWERAGMLQGLLNLLPDEAWLPVGTRMLAMVAARPELEQRFLREETLERFGDLGPVALDVMERYLGKGSGKRVRGASKGVALGLCRLGPEAARLADALAAPLIGREKLARNVAIPAIAALMRMGRQDLARRIEPDDRYGQETAALVRAEVTSASPRDVCMGYSGWNRRRRGR